MLTGRHTFDISNYLDGFRNQQTYITGGYHRQYGGSQAKIGVAKGICLQVYIRVYNEQYEDG